MPDDVTDRKIRREVGKILWCIANGEKPRADVRMNAGQRSAVDHAAVDLIELYEKSADCVLVELYEGWQNAVNSDRSPEEFAYVLVAEAFDMVREAGFESLLRGGRPTFAIELHGTDLTWDGELREPELDQRRNPTIPSQEEYLGETLGAPELNPGPTKHWYAFYWENLRQKPKSYQGPFTLESSARTAMNQEIEKYGDADRSAYRIKHLSADEFTKIWGAPPVPNPAGPACPGCGAKMHRDFSSRDRGDAKSFHCTECSMDALARDGELATPLASPKAFVTRRGRPPGVPVANPGSKLPWRVPTIDELAKAWAYIEREYTLKEGNIDGEQWAEALAFVASHPSHTYVDAEDRRIAQEMFPQLSERDWRMIAARADYFLTSEGEQPRFKVTA